jgi:hypothetical protein
MAVLSLAGASFTVGVGPSTATDVTAQITDGTITADSTVERVRTLGPNIAFVGTDLAHSADLNFLYDEESGFYSALDTATTTNDALTVTITGGGGEWTGTMYVSTLSVSFAADGLASCSASFTGELVFAAATP